ncbi:hypothetical protein [Marinagarivorans algicola]|uniref:hypothetical protein n=1 Tax=Marinagarivorans algicola TaxID=1513270 RepID=UPI0012E30C6D|nr:hypothetical protein [Marinagarivorans algicola]
MQYYTVDPKNSLYQHVSQWCMTVVVVAFWSVALCAQAENIPSDAIEQKCPDYEAAVRAGTPAQHGSADKQGSMIQRTDSVEPHVVANKRVDVPKQLKIVGSAHNFEGVLLYCEYHSVITTQYPAEQKTWWVEYYSIKDQAIIAKKTLAYQPFDREGIAPSVEQIDYRSGELRRSMYVDDSLKFVYRKDRAQALKTQWLAKSPLLVVDAGFDPFVRSQWSALVNGQPVFFEFGSIAHLRSLPLRVIRKPLDACNTHSEAFMCLHVQASNRFLRWFVGELALVYDAQRRLKVFQGTVNLQSDQAKGQKAVITYVYR